MPVTAAPTPIPRCIPVDRVLIATRRLPVACVMTPVAFGSQPHASQDSHSPWAEPGEAARRYGISQGWVGRLLARYRSEGGAAFEPRSRRPLTSPNAVSPPEAGLVRYGVIRPKQLRGGDQVDAFGCGPFAELWRELLASEDDQACCCGVTPESGLVIAELVQYVDVHDAAPFA